MRLLHVSLDRDFSQSVIDSSPIYLHSFDTSMSQKSAFKMQQAGNFKPRKAFPQLPGGVIENPKFLSTDKGKLLIDGWWAWSRKPVSLSMEL